MRVLVTGGARRLGAELCEMLARKGYSVVVHYRSSEREAMEVADKCRETGAEADVIFGDFSDIRGLEKFAESYADRFSSMNVLINNVGDYILGSTLNTSWDEWTRLFHLNLHAPFFLIRRFSPYLIASEGQIVNVGVSGLLRHSGNVYSTAYTLSKEALWGLTRACALELAADRVRVNMVSPGMLDISEDIAEPGLRIPMGRPGTCAEVAEAVAFLLDRKNAYITGQNIEIAGGLGLK